MHEGENDFNGELLHWLLDAISMQAQQRLNTGLAAVRGRTSCSEFEVVRDGATPTLRPSSVLANPRRVGTA